MIKQSGEKFPALFLLIHELIIHKIKGMRKKYLHLLLLMVLSHYYFCQSKPTEIKTTLGEAKEMPDFSKVPMLHEGDSAGIVYLIQHGIKVSNGEVDCWFPKDSLSIETMQQIVNKINAGVIGAEKLIRTPFAWQVHQKDEKYTLYFRVDNFVSHASFYNYVSIPFWRIKNDEAPWLHELIHEMLNSKNGRWFPPQKTREERMKNQPLWLFEGLPEYISIDVFKQYNYRSYDVLTNSYYTLGEIDSLFIQDLRLPQTNYVLGFIGEKGVLPELFSKDRQLFAPIFYHGSCSFIKFLSTHYGIDMLVNAISSFDNEQSAIEHLTGKSMITLKDEWLKNLQ